MNIYLLEGKESYLVKRDKQNILAPLLEDSTVTELDGSDRRTFSLREALRLADTVSLFDNRRIVIINDPFFLTTSGSASEKEEAASLLESYCRNPNPDSIVMFICSGWNADKRTAAFRILSKYPSVKIVSHKEQKFQNLTAAIDEILRNSGLTFTKEADAEIRLRASGSLSEVYRALDSFRLYGADRITKRDVEHLMPPNPEADIWRLGEALLKKDAPSMLRAYRDLKETAGYSDLDMIPLIASQIRRIYNTRKCMDCGMSDQEIKDYLKTNTVYYDYQNSKRYSTQQLLGMLSSLADLEQGIKSGRAEEKGSIETWLLNRI
ncbi:MAG: DNA polymerase III subunit delta [Solobacterium sp.]|nr:DNA polymerase III subunit delta [Solobacterium sp.]